MMKGRPHSGAERAPSLAADYILAWCSWMVSVDRSSVDVYVLKNHYQCAALHPSDGVLFGSVSEGLPQHNVRLISWCVAIIGLLCSDDSELYYTLIRIMIQAVN
jgi:hypothetical protein